MRAPIAPPLRRRSGSEASLSPRERPPPSPFLSVAPSPIHEPGGPPHVPGGSVGYCEAFAPTPSQSDCGSTYDGSDAETPEDDYVVSVYAYCFSLLVLC